MEVDEFVELILGREWQNGVEDGVERNVTKC